MDPNATLAIMRQTIAQFRQAYDDHDPTNAKRSTMDELIDLGDTLAESAGALDDWITSGGARPAAWSPKATHAPQAPTLDGRRY
jgi:hypothetical protein